MQTSMNPYNNEGGLVDKYIGTAYENVKAVADAMAQVKHLSENMQSIYDFAATKDAFEAFSQNPDFYDWLVANQDNMENLSELLASLVQDYATLAGANFTGFVKLGSNGVGKKELYYTGNMPVIGSTSIFVHNTNPAKIIGISGVVHKSNGSIEALLPTFGADARVWCDAEYVRLSVDEEATAYGGRPYHVILTIIE